MLAKASCLLQTATGPRAKRSFRLRCRGDLDAEVRSLGALIKSGAILASTGRLDSCTVKDSRFKMDVVRNNQLIDFELSDLCEGLSLYATHPQAQASNKIPSFLAEPPFCDLNITGI